MRGRSRAAPLTTAMLGIVTVFVVAFLFFPRQVGAFLGTQNVVRHADYKIEGMLSQASLADVANAIRAVPGVVSVEVDLESGRAVVGLEACCQVSHDTILAAVERAGYTGSFVPAQRPVLVASRLCCTWPPTGVERGAKVPATALALAQADEPTPSASADEAEKEQVAGQQQTAVLRLLSKDFHELREAFNAEEHAVKVMLIVSPVCPMCRMGAGIVQQKALAKINSDQLAIYVVWIPRFPGDSREQAHRAMQLVPDKRARHFWDSRGGLGELYGKVVDLPGGQGFAWDVYFVFDRDARWSDTPPTPDFWMHQLGGSETGNRLDGEKVRRAIAQRLGAIR